MLGDQQDGAAPLAADGEALREAKRHQQCGGQVTDLLVRGQASHQERGDADEDDRDLQKPLAAVLVTEVAEHDAAERAGDEAHGVRDERGDDRA